MRTLFAAITTLLLADVATAQKTVSFPTADGGTVFADVYGDSDRSVVLAHGGRFRKESWEKQARVLEASGFRVLALDFRGYGKSKGPGDSEPMNAPLYLDPGFGPLFAKDGSKDCFGRWRQHGRGSCWRRIDCLAAGGD